MGIRYILSRIVELIPVLFFVTLIVFAFSHLLPGDAITAQIGSLGGEGEAIERARRELGLDQPIVVQYGVWLRGVLTGDFGRSIMTHQPVSNALIERFPVTLQLAAESLLISFMIAFPVGVLSAYRRNSRIDRIATILALTGVAMPSFWLGLLMILFFSVQLGWFPPSGYVKFSENPWQNLYHMALPAFALGAVQAAVVMRQIRSSLLEVLNEDYIRTARAKGLTESRVLLTHALRNALLPVLTVMGLQVGRVLGGSVIVETVFAIPGLGRYSVNAIFAHDYPVVQGAVLLTALVVVIANLVTDLLYAVFDPRIRLG